MTRACYATLDRTLCMCVYVCLRISYRDLTHQTTGISLLAVPMKQRVSLTFGKPHQLQMTVHLYLGGILLCAFTVFKPAPFCPLLLQDVLYGHSCDFERLNFYIIFAIVSCPRHRLLCWLRDHSLESAVPGCVSPASLHSPVVV